MRPAVAIAALVTFAASAIACGSSDDSGRATPSPETLSTPSAPAATATPPPTTGVSRFELTTVLAGTESPVDLEFAPDGRLFYNELHTGRVRVVSGGRLLSEPFADLDVVNLSDRYSEHGLLGLALPPDFQTSHHVYVFLSVPDARGEPLKQQVLRLTDDGGLGADPTVVLDGLPIGESRHNGGRLAFGPDGKLYVSIGDAGDAAEAAQDPADLRGKILRVNPDGSVPDGNPFPGSPVWATGLRNPFGLAFDQNNTLWATENSDSGHDEVNFINRGLNYGWPEVTGFTGITGQKSYVEPAAESGDSESWAPTGIAALDGDLFFCSYNRRSLLRVTFQNPAIARGRVEDTGQPCAYDVAAGPDGALYLATEDAIYRWGPPR